MCRCKYPKAINKKGVSIIEDEKRERCYKVSLLLGKKGSNILVIVRAPKAMEEDSFNSVYKRVIKFLDMNKDEFEGIQKVTIVSLFTLYETTRGDLYEEYLLKGKEYIEGNDGEINNDKIIAEEIHNADYIIAAWGEPLEGLDDVYRRRVELMLKDIREEIMNSAEKKSALMVGERSKRGYPRHCLAWSYRDELNSLWE
ncbi:DUF1643 domain-containing protein [Clostridium paraputrificum]|uniref:DUF1643 domain-containing protein n=1 Tax=Clostridium TaxID=1485 RepID=UPI003D326DAF